MSVGLTTQQKESEDAALQHKRYVVVGMDSVMCCCMDHTVYPLPHVGCSLLEEKVDRLIDMMTRWTEQRVGGWRRV